MRVTDVLALAGLAHAVTLDRVRENDGRPLDRVAGRAVGGKEFFLVVAAAHQVVVDLVVGHVGDQFLQLRVSAEKALADVGAALVLEVLVLAVDALHHALAQQVALRARQQAIPARAPQHLDHVPARAAEIALELLHDLAVAAHRPVEALQVAVDDEHQIVELLARGQRDRALRLRLVHFPVAEECPDLASLGHLVGARREAAILEVFEEARLVDRHDRAEPHRHRRELPEIRHQVRMRVRGQALAVDLAAEILEARLVDPALEVGARVGPGRGVSLDEHHVGAVRVLGALPEMVVADLVHDRRGLEARDMAAGLGRLAVGADHHRGRVPAQRAQDFLLDFEVAGVRRLLFRRNGIDVRRVVRVGRLDALLVSLVDGLFQQEPRARGAVAFDDDIDRFFPLAGLLGIDIGRYLRVAHFILLLAVAAAGAGRAQCFRGA